VIIVTFRRMAAGFDASPFLTKSLERCSRLSDDGLGLRIGMQPRLRDKPVVMNGRRDVTEPVGQPRALPHQRHSAIVHAIPNPRRRAVAARRRKQTKLHIPGLRRARTRRVEKNALQRSSHEVRRGEFGDDDWVAGGDA
jgi:hypothetical protein